jgi:hypothetical protein
VLDDYTRETYLLILDEGKGEAFDSWKQLKERLDRRHWPLRVAFVRTDMEPLYVSAKWDKHCEEEGIEREYSSRYRHDQNGTIERAMQAIGVPFRCMMIQGNAPDSDVDEALLHANVIRNNSPTKANNGMTPREKAVGKRLPVNKRLLRGPLFCLCYAHVYEDERVKGRKQDARGVACVYLGFDETNNVYRVKDWVTGQKYWTADVTFHPTVFPYRNNPQRSPGLLHQHEDQAPHITQPQRPAEARRSERQREYLSSGGQDLLAIPDLDVSPDQPACNFTVSPDPSCWEEAVKGPDAAEWIEAMLKEQASFEQHGVFEVVARDAARGKKIFKSKVVLKKKMKPPTVDEPLGSIDKYKYRLTIAAFTRMLVQGVDYQDKYASTVRWNSIKALIAIAVKQDYDIVLFDVSTFYLYAKLNDEVYMEIPQTWEVEDKPRSEHVYKLKKAMYGLPQASRCAQQELRRVLTTDGHFRPTTADDCVYVNTHEEEYSAVGAHVDDLLAVGCPRGLGRTRSVLTETFEITEERNPTVVTGVQIERDRPNKWLKLHQAAYIAEILAKFKMDDARPASTPMDKGTAMALMLLPVDQEDPQSLKSYQALVGSLMWLDKTRPDMLFTINLLARFLKSATKKHLDLARGRPLRYLKATIDYGIVFQSGTGQWSLSGAADADLAGDLRSSRSTTGYMTRLGEFGAIVCSSKLERKVATSTGQAETYALLALVKEVTWERHLLHELRFPQASPTLVLTDNEGVLKQSVNAINHAAAKHYRIAQAHIRSMVDNGTIETGGTPSAFNPADMMTKSLDKGAFLRHRFTIMGPQTPPSR